MSKAEEIKDKIIKRCWVNIDRDYDASEYFSQALEQCNDHQYLPYLIQSISQVMAEEIEALEEKIAKKKTREHKKIGSPYDTNIPRNRTRGPG